MTSDNVQVTVVGARQLRATLRRAGDDMQELKQAHARAAGYVASAAARVVPVRTGRLAASIRPSGTKTAAVVRAGYARLPYAGPIHWGWPRRHISPTLYLTGPAAATEAQWVPMYLDDVEHVLDRVKGA